MAGEFDETAIRMIRHLVEGGFPAEEIADLVVFHGKANKKWRTARIKRYLAEIRRRDASSANDTQKEPT